MALTCGLGLSRAKTTLKGIFRGKEKQQPDESQDPSSSPSSKKRQSRFFGGSATSKSEEGASKQPTSGERRAEEPSQSSVAAVAPASTKIEEQKKDPDEDMAAAVMSAGDTASEGKPPLPPAKDEPNTAVSEERDAAISPPHEAKHVDRTEPSAAASDIHTSTQPAKLQEDPSELESPTSKPPTASEIEDAEIKEAQAVVEASKARGPPSAAENDSKVAKDEGKALKTAVDQAGAGGSLMGMSATSGPLSDLPALP